MTRFLKNNILPLLLYFAALAVAIYFLITAGRSQIHLSINQYVGNRYINALFYYITYLGDGTVAFLTIGLISVFNLRLGLCCLIAFLLAAGIASGLKYSFFDDVDRPHFVFQYIEPAEIRKVEGVHLHIHNSFPSGHATQAFAIFTCLAFAAKNQLLKISMIVVALLTSFSRVYLSQHFLADITAGSVIGFVVAVVVFSLFIGANKLPQLNRPLKSLRGA